MDGDTNAVMLADLTLTRILRAHLEGDRSAEQILRGLNEDAARLVLAIAIIRLADSTTCSRGSVAARSSRAGAA